MRGLSASSQNGTATQQNHFRHYKLKQEISRTAKSDNRVKSIKKNQLQQADKYHIWSTLQQIETGKEDKATTQTQSYSHTVWDVTNLSWRKS